MTEDYMKGMNEEEYAEWAASWNKSPCPFCGIKVRHSDCPDEAPDFCCRECFEAGAFDND